MAERPHQLGKGQRHAGVIACDHAPATMTAVLESPEAEAQALATLLASNACAFQVYTFLGAASDSTRVKAALTDRCATLGPADSLVVVWSGHGLLWERDLVLATVDADNDTQTGGLTCGWLRDEIFLTSTLGHVVLILNCCHGAVGIASADVSAAVTMTFEAGERPFKDAMTRRVIAAAQTEEAAHEAQGQSALLSRVLWGLAGEADYQGLVTVESLWTYLDVTMRSLDQRPSLGGVVSVGGLALAWHPDRAPVTKGDLKDPSPTPLDAAHAILATLPTDAIPDYRPLPPGSLAPLAPSTVFVGRTEEVLHLATLLKGGGATVLTPATIATGLGGVGKTSLALEVAYRYGTYFAGGVFWLDSSDDARLRGALEQCSVTLDLYPSDQQVDSEQRIQDVRRLFDAPMPRLLVFDNCEDPQTFAHYRPSGSSGCRIILTSRNTDWSLNYVQTLPIDILSPAASRQLLQQLAPAISDADADRLSDAVGYLPLALHLVGATLAATQEDAIVYANAFAQKRTAILERSAALMTEEAYASPTSHLWSIRATVLMSYERLPANMAADCRTLRRTWPGVHPNSA